MDVGPLHFRTLQATLSQLPSVDDGAALEQAYELKVQLDKSKVAFRRLLEKLPPNPKEKEELERGRLLPFGATGIKAVNQEFRLEALFLASQLGISERLAGSVLLAVLNDHRPRPGRPTAENAVILYYEERRDLLRCLELLLSIASDSDLLASLEGNVAALIVSFTNDLVSYEDPRDGSWTKKILKEIDNQQKAMEDIRNGVQPTPSTSTSGPQARFNDDINNLRIESHREERRLLATILYHASAARLLPKGDILALIRWTASVKEPSNDKALPVALSAILVILDPTSLASLDTLVSDAKFITDLHSFITTKVNWKSSHGAEVSPIQSLVQLAWCLFLINAFRHRVALINETKIWENVIEDGIIDAIHSGALDFCGNSFLRFKKPVDPFEELGWSAGTREELSSFQQCPPVDPSFQPIILRRVDSLMETFIVNASSVLRKVRHREEDVLLAASLGRASGTPGRRRALSASRRGSDIASQPTNVSAEQRHDVESLFALIATLYRDSSDAALKYWLDGDDEDSDAQHRHSRLSSFLRWAADCRVPSMQQAFFDMLGSLASGPRSAALAFEFLAQNSSSDTSSSSLCSWNSLFDALAFYGSPKNHGGPTEIPPEEVLLLKSFLRVLRVITENSPLARASLYDNQRYKPVSTLFTLIVQPIPIDLKAALLEAVAAFAKVSASNEGSGMAALGTEISKRTWIILEGSQILPTIPQRDTRGVISRGQANPTGGIGLELEQVETPSKVYPATTAFVNLLVALLGTSSGVAGATDAASGLASLEASSSVRAIPDNLGSPHRDPSYGIDAYTRFVVDDVLLKCDSREYKSPEEHWRVTERCLAYIEASLATINFSPLITMDGNASPASAVQRIVIHPGFDVLVRLLSGSRLLDKVFKLASVELDELDNEDITGPVALMCLVRTLRIILRVFAVQTAFIEVVIPIILENSATTPSDKLSSLRSVSPLDQHLLYNSHVVVKISVLVNCFRAKTIALASVRILTFLAASTTFSVTDMFRDIYKTKMNRLAGLIDASDETERVVAGFVQRLNRPAEFADISPSSNRFDADADDSCEDSVIQHSILDLLLRNTQPSSASPNLAHLLLGFDIRQRSENLEIADPSGEVMTSCLHVVMSFLTRIQCDAIGQSPTNDIPNLLLEGPSLAEKCYRLIRQLCLHDYSSRAVSQYLRGSLDYFASQAQILPLQVPPAFEDQSGTLILADGTQLPTTPVAVISTLASQAWTMESLAVELSSLVSLEENERAVRILAALFSPRESASFEQDRLRNGGEALSQTLPTMLEIFYSLDVSWIDALPVNDTPINLLGGIPFDSCLRFQPNGCEVYDFQAVLTLLQAGRRDLQAQGSMNSQQLQDTVRSEAHAILQNLAIENNRREIRHARYHSLTAWRNLLDVTLTRAFDLLPSTGSDTLLLDLIASILPPIAAEDADNAIQDIFAGAAVVLMAQIRQQGMHQLALQSTATQLFSVDRLLAVFQSLLQAIVQPGLTPTVRGNLYAVFLQYIQHSSGLTAFERHGVSRAANHFNDAQLGGGVSDDTRSIVSTSIGGNYKGNQSSLQRANTSCLRSYLDRLLTVVTLDASAGHEVWQTVSYTMLDGIASLLGTDSGAPKLAALLAKQGYLQSFVASFKESESDLLDTLRPDPDSLNAIYAYEAKMSFMTRLALTQEGASRFLEIKLLPRLADCAYLSAKPRAADVAIDFDAFLPPVVQRYYQLLLPALQIALAIASQSAERDTSAARQLFDFLVSQQDALRAVVEDATVSPTLSSLQASHLVVQILSVAATLTSIDDLTSARSLGPIHSSLMTLSGRVLAEQTFIEAVEPSIDEEVLDAEQTYATGRLTTSLFRDKVSKAVENLQLALLRYFKASTKNRNGKSFQALWLPTFELEVTGRGRHTPLPTLRGAFSFVLDIADALQDRLQLFEDLDSKLANIEDLGIGELEVYSIPTPNDAFIDIQDRRQRIIDNMLKMRRESQSGICTSLYLIELALLLLWRHLAYYLDDGRSGWATPKDPAPNGFENVRPGQALRSNQELKTLRQNASSAFGLLSDALGDLHLTPNMLLVDVRPHQSLISSLLRSVLDILGNEQ